MSRISVFPQEITIQKGSTYFYQTAKFLGSEIELHEVRWYSNNESVATVNNITGYIYGVDIGTTIIRVSSGEGDENQAYMTVHVIDSVILPTCIRLDRNGLTLRGGEANRLEVEFCLDTVTNKVVKWRSSDESVATVDACGRVTGLKKGSCTVTAKTCDGSGLEASCFVYVLNDIYVSNITLVPTHFEMYVSETGHVGCVVEPYNATNKRITLESSNWNVLDVDNDGTMTALAPGQADIIATAYDDGGFTTRQTINVREQIYVNSIQISNTSFEMRTEDEAELTVINVLPENADVKDYYVDYDSDIISYDIHTNKIVAKKEGTTTIEFKSVDRHMTVATCEVTVDDTIYVTGVEVSPKTKTMNVGDTAYLSKTVYPTNATNQNVSWTSSDASVVEVNSSTGFIRAKKAGTVTITATTADGGFCDYSTVNIREINKLFNIAYTT